MLGVAGFFLFQGTGIWSSG